jgi:hypothetical protein
MAEGEREEEREERIIMEIVVDAYGPEEQAMGWHYYLQDMMQFPFTATYISKRRSSPLKAQLLKWWVWHRRMSAITKCLWRLTGRAIRWRCR